ncbi:uncharacterized protein ALTATR162_LOCUS11326 [Alternaria atra]|uniref:Uncharacterized protein n=1 Tax=Alternaria atra TaxID=119953 RepID=A0A8J2IB12_9PLEO|nr:uncharacterized protein ALTATR162_LOCUS11326 [Alternaria atra]CAG5185510.1 unnamed protein product [Alternaria atra]
MSLASSKRQKTLDRVGRDYSTSEPDERNRVGIANEYAMAIASIQTYGQRLSPEKNNRMEMWIERLPYDWQFEDANTAHSATVIVYEDWLDWSKPKALSWLSKLDKFERRFRIAGVAYHEIPYALRHSSTLVHGPKIDKVILVRLSQVFETDRPRSQQSFFRPWNEIFNVVNGILTRLKANKTTPKNVDRLRILESGFEVVLSQLPKPLCNLEAALLWVEEQVANLTERSELDGSVNLAAKHSREGGLFRIWIQTFLEIEYGMVESKSDYTEGFVDAVLRDEGIVEDAYWSVLADGCDGDI